MAKPVASYLPPRGPLNATLITWECGREMHRVHDDALSHISFVTPVEG
jgi:hypothetical protein